MNLLYAICLEILAKPVWASSTFQTDCHIPPEFTNFVLAANVRGTLDILWTSLFTLFTCCWTVQHLNVPRQMPKSALSQSEKDSLPAWRANLSNIFRTIRRDCLRILPKCKWMILTLFMPEFLVGKALQDRRLATEFIKDLKTLPYNAFQGLEWAKKNWTLTHGFYIDMGGFALKTGLPMEPEEEQTPIFLNIRSLLYVCGLRKSTSPATRNGTEWIVDTSSIVGEIPRITEEEIKDRSKSDFFMKCITIGQLTWFIIQIIARGARGLAIPQIEIAVLAYAACTGFTFLLCLSKPKDVQVPTLLLAQTSKEHEPPSVEHHTGTRPVAMSYGEFKPQLLGNQDRSELARLHPASWFWITLRSHRFFGQKQRLNKTETILSPIPNDARYSHEPAMFALLTHMDDGFILAGMIFGGIHCASWYSDFPTPTEQLLWRVASIFTAGLLPIYYGVLLIDIHRGWIPAFGKILPFFEFCTILGYTLARLYLVVEIFRSLCFQPPSSFVATWSSEIPHVA
ncbi:hypothetical protein F5B19DRAFT_486433 [Rostrohypoxylon terebratum]|nr:hypothetical protein F5B19DRAFT_486433 [Rostrohypoxylon terebratum]